MLMVIYKSLYTHPKELSEFGKKISDEILLKVHFVPHFAIT